MSDLNYQSSIKSEIKAFKTKNEDSDSQNDEAEKVEESLRDFIGKIITYYEKFNINNTLLVKYE